MTDFLLELLSEEIPAWMQAKARNDLVRVLGKSNIDHLLILAADYESLEFVLLDKRKKKQQGPAANLGRPPG